MKKHTRDLFLHPFLFQETAVILVLAPVVVIFFMAAIVSAQAHFSEIVQLAGIAANVGLVVGTLTKYLPLRPAFEIMEKGSCTPQEMGRAVRSLSYLPLTEAIVCFLRFGVSGNLIGTLTLYLRGNLSLEEFVMSINTVCMMGFMLMPVVYLISENSLNSFYEKHDMKGVLDSGEGLFKLSISTKTVCTMFLICAPALELVVSLFLAAERNQLNHHGINVALAVIVAEAVVLMFLSTSLLMRNIKLSMGRMSVMFKDIAQGQGDLTKRLPINGLNEVGELSFWFNEFMDDLEQIVGHMRETSLELDHAIQAVSVKSRGISQSAHDQAATVEQVTASFDGINEAVKHNSELVGEGRKTSHAVTKLIDQSRGTFSRLTTAINDVSMDSRKIGDIVSTVNEVAFHTNLLALNASVEAARAGEHGKGFAVVAGEVRSLAQRSAGAANEIRQLIEGTVGSIRNSDEMMSKTSSSHEELMNRMDVFFAMMEEISASITEQLRNIDELSSSITRIGATTQENAATVEELASTLEGLRKMANVLANDMRRFKISQAANADGFATGTYRETDRPGPIAFT